MSSITAEELAQLKRACRQALAGGRFSWDSPDMVAISEGRTTAPRMTINIVMTHGTRGVEVGFTGRSGWRWRNGELFRTTHAACGQLAAPGTLEVTMAGSAINFVPKR